MIFTDLIIGLAPTLKSSIIGGLHRGEISSSCNDFNLYTCSSISSSCKTWWLPRRRNRRMMKNVPIAIPATTNPIVKGSPIISKYFKNKFGGKPHVQVLQYVWYCILLSRHPSQGCKQTLQLDDKKKIFSLSLFL